MKTVGLVDFVWNGHHATYYRIFAETLLRSGYQVVAFYGEKPHLVLENVTQQDEYNSKRFHSFMLPPNSSGPLWLPWSVRKYIVNFFHFYTASLAIKRAAEQLSCNFDLVFFNSIYDASLLSPYYVDKIFPYPWTGLALNYRSIREQPSQLSKGISDPFGAFRASNCRAVCVLDSGISSSLSLHLDGKLVLNFPDVTDETPPDYNFSVAKDLRNLTKGRKIISCLGSLDKRKGLLRLLEISQKMKELNVFFLFAGEFSGYGYSAKEKELIYNTVQHRPDNCLFYLNSIRDGADFNSLVCSSDILFLAYEDFTNSSNLLTKAAIFKKPVIAHNEYCVGEVVEKYKLGITVVPGDTRGYINAINLLCRNALEISLNGTQAKFNEYSELHSVDMVVEVFKRLVG